MTGGDFSDYLLPDTNIMLIVVLYSMSRNRGYREVGIEPLRESKAINRSSSQL